MNYNVTIPNTTEELLAQISEHQNGNFRFGAGCTDLLMELKRQPAEDLTVISLNRIADDQFTSIRRSGDTLKIGSLVTARELLSNREVSTCFPVLHQAAYNLASRQIRQVATVGGNVCTASPAGDIACALVALKAKCSILSASGSIRELPIDQFFTGVRTTALKSDEILQSVTLSVSDAKLHSGFIKVGTRRSMECAVVSLAFHIPIADDGSVGHAGVAIGSAAPTIKFTDSACDYLAGKQLDSVDADQFAAKVTAYATPISDIRASAWYRSEVLRNISRGILSV